MTKQTAIITGGTRGIGKGIAKAFLENNYKVVINYRTDEKSAEETLREFDSPHVSALKADVSTKEGRQKLVSETLQCHQEIHVLVNNAAVASRYGFFKTSEEEFDRLYSTNVKAPIFLGKLVAEHMIEKSIKGSIINIASVAGHRPFGIIYGDSKAALLMATKNMAAKCAAYGIRVNSITPGTHKTDLNRHSWEQDPAGWQKHCKENIPLGFWGNTFNLGQAAVFLASENATYITGADLLIDGGFLSKR